MDYKDEIFSCSQIWKNKCAVKCRVQNPVQCLFALINDKSIKHYIGNELKRTEY